MENDYKGDMIKNLIKFMGFKKFIQRTIEACEELKMGNCADNLSDFIGHMMEDEDE